MDDNTEDWKQRQKELAREMRKKAYLRAKKLKLRYEADRKGAAKKEKVSKQQDNDFRQQAREKARILRKENYKRMKEKAEQEAVKKRKKKKAEYELENKAKDSEGTPPLVLESLKLVKFDRENNTFKAMDRIPPKLRLILSKNDDTV
ncbi:MAG: hypothetical protein R3B45_08480 [Bdellovibrionota bacterium]